MLVLTLFVLAMFALWPRLRPRFSQAELSKEVVAVIQRESKASFLITGQLDIVATTTVRNTRRVLPQLLDVSLGTSTATVQVPGRAYYGFDVRKLRPEQINRTAGDTIEIEVPQPEVHSVEPNLSGMRAWTAKGWGRTSGSVQRAERSALALINGALHRQAMDHVASSAQPHINTAAALQQLLMPVIRSFGIKEPVFRFRIGERIIIEP